MRPVQPGFFAYEEQLARLSDLGDKLERLNRSVDWQFFVKELNAKLPRIPNPQGGRPPFEHLLMFKIMILKRLHNCSDAVLEFLLTDRLCFQRFVGLTLGDDVPDANTIWLYQEQLKKAGLIRRLFKQYLLFLRKNGLKLGRKGSIVDATFIEVPRQRNTKEENAQIKSGEIPEDWKAPDKKSKLAQKDLEARWAKKNNESHFGFKDHIKADAATKLITDYQVTSAEVHDSQVLGSLLAKEDAGRPLHADSAYKSAKTDEELRKKGIINRIHEKGTRNHPLSPRQKKSNRTRSRVRARVEHVFAFFENSMNADFIRTVGRARAEVVIGLNNLVYNMMRAACFGWGMAR